MEDLNDSMGAYRRKENAGLIWVMMGYFWNKRDIKDSEKDIKVLSSNFPIPSQITKEPWHSWFSLLLFNDLRHQDQGNMALSLLYIFFSFLYTFSPKSGA